MLTLSQDRILILLALHSQSSNICFSAGVQRLDISGLVRPVCVAQPRVCNPDNTVNEGGRHLNTADLAWMAAALDFMLSDWSASWAFSISSLPTWRDRKKNIPWNRSDGSTATICRPRAVRQRRWSPPFRKHLVWKLSLELIVKLRVTQVLYVTSPRNLCNTYMSRFHAL